ncbi:MAG: DUF4386 domain-containing protein [Balneolaceae bacterium]
MTTQHTELKRKARFAGVLYLLLIIMGLYGAMFVTPKIQVIGDIQTTFDNLLENEFLFRTSIFAHLINTVVFTMLVLAFYKILVPVDKYIAMLMVAFVVVHVSFEFGAEAMNLTALAIAKGQFLGSLELLQWQEWAYLFFRASKFTTAGLAVPFWGLWLVTLGTLVYRSGFFPKIFGVLLFAGGAAYIIESFFFFLFPGVARSLLPFLFVFYAAGPISFMLWLLIKGVKDNQRQINQNNNIT